MSEDLAPYARYRASGNPWLGELPDHWSLRRMKTLVVERNEKGFSDEPLLAATQTKGVVRKDQYETRTVTALKDLHLLKLVRTGDFVISLRSFQGGIEFAREQGIISPAYTVLSAIDGINHRFLARLVKSWPFIDNLSLHVTGIREGQNIDYQSLARSTLPLPPPLEQASIVRFLDYVDRRIRRYIDARQTLIKLLVAQKQAIIQRAVTRGVDPTVPLKHSGIEWLGEVPEHWDVRRVKALSPVRRGASPRPIADPKYFNNEGEYAWVRIADVTASRRYLERTTQRLSALGQSLSVTLEPGALFLSIAGSVGKPMIAGIKCCIHDGFVYFPQFRGNVEFLYSVFASGAPFARLGKLGTQLNLNTETVGGIYIGWPPAGEQAAIVSFLANAIAEADAAIDHAQRQVALTYEYRTRLIADVVTGKLDVRKAAERLPEEADDSQSRDDEKSELLDGIGLLPEAEEGAADAADAVPEEVIA